MNQAFRFANEGADENTWAQYVLAMERINIGVNTCKLYNDGGVLKLSKGRIGIDDGTQPSICEIDTVETIALTGSTSQWQEVYMTIAGTAVSFDTVNIAGATDWSILPAGFTDLYNAEKEGYYIAANRRCIGIVWADSTGNLEGVINTESGMEGYNGYCYYDNNEDIKLMWRKIKDSYRNWGEYKTGAWNMDTTDQIIFTHHITNYGNIRNIVGVVESNAGDIYTLAASAINGTLGGEVYYTSTQIFTNRTLAVNNGKFDNASFNAANCYINFDIKE